MDCKQHTPVVIEQQSKTQFKGMLRKDNTVTVIKATKVKCFSCGKEETIEWPK